MEAGKGESLLPILGSNSIRDSLPLKAVTLGGYARLPWTNTFVKENIPRNSRVLISEIEIFTKVF
jgi:hypothetical protein